MRSIPFFCCPPSARNYTLEKQRKLLLISHLSATLARMTGILQTVSICRRGKEDYIDHSCEIDRSIGNRMYAAA